MKSGNLLDQIDPSAKQELTQLICRREGVRIERIVSTGQSSPPGFWYDQPEHEWVLVLEGRGVIEFEGQRPDRELVRGDFLLIEPHCRHRVSWTDPDKPTVWLAVFFQ